MENLHSQDWLKEQGLKASGLTLTQILSSLGFQQCSGEVECLGHSVTSQYGVGLFLQHPDQTGHVYNLVDANEQMLEQIELKLIAVIDSLKTRLERCSADEGAALSADITDLESELEEAKNTLAQIQALRMEVVEKARNNSESHKVTIVPKKNQMKPHKTQLKPLKAKYTAVQRKTDQPKPHHPTQSSTSTMGAKPTQKRKPKLGRPRQDKGDLSRRPNNRPTTSGRGKGSRRPMVGVVKGSTVLARCKSDGFYYKGVVAGGLSKGCADVQFQDGEKQVTTPLNEMLVVGGACPKPHLRTYDYVLCCVRTPHGRHSSMYGVCDVFIPAQVQVAPTETTMNSSLFSVATFTGDHIVSPRSGLVRITESRYRVITSQLVKHEPVAIPQSNSSTALSKLEDFTRSSTNGGSDIVPQVVSTPEKEDRATLTEPVETEEKGVIARVSTQEQAVCTNPMMVDQSTTTTAAEDQPTTRQLGVTDETDSAEWEKGTRIFCCWPQSSWYCKASVLGRASTASCLAVRAETGDLADVPYSHIVLPLHNQPITEGAKVLAEHPMFQGFAPATVTATGVDQSSFSVKLYDGFQVAKAEVHEITPAQHGAAVTLLEERGKRWVGQTVIARRESDGVYYPAVVKQQLEQQSYQLQWAEGTEQTQSIQHIFGPLTVRRSLQAGDHVLALAMPGIGACLPGTVTGIGNEHAVEIKFSDGERQMVHKDQCFWISPAYFLSAVEFISASFYNNQ